MLPPDDEFLFSRSCTATVPVSAEVEARSRKNLSRILHGLASVGQVHVAGAIGLHESNITRWKEKGEFERMSTMLAAMGLRIALPEQKVMSQDEFNMLMRFAKIGMRNMTEADLSFED
jgi:hypothetical protein